MALDSNLRILSWQILDQSNISGGGGDVTISGADAREIIEDVIYDALTEGDNILITYNDIPDPGIIRIGTTSSITVENLTASGIGTFGGSTQIATTGSGIDVIHFTEGVGGILCTDFTVSGTEHKVYNAGQWVSYMGTDYWDDSLSGNVTWNAGLGQYDVSGSFYLNTTGDWPIAFRPTKMRLTISGSPSGYLDFYVKDVFQTEVGYAADFAGGVVEISPDENGDYGWNGADLERIQYEVGGGIAITNIEFFTTHYALESAWNTLLDVHANSIRLGDSSIIRESTFVYGSPTASITGLRLSSPVMMYNDDDNEAMMWINKGIGNNLFFISPKNYLNKGYPDDTFTGYNNIVFTHGGFINPLTGANHNVLLDTGVNHHYLTTGQRNVFIGAGSSGRVTTGDNNVFIGNYIALDQDDEGRTADSQFNIGIGYRIFHDLYQTMGSYNIAMGFEAGHQMDGIGNVALGYHALRYVSTRNYQVAIGYEAGRSGGGTAGGHGLIAIGHQAGYGTYGEYNIAIGYGSQYQNNEGDYNITIGYRAGRNLRDGAYRNIFIGQDAGTYATNKNDGVWNIGIGYLALSRIGSGSGNIGIGEFAGEQSSSSYNIFIGWKAGQNATGNISALTYVGVQAGQGSTGGHNTYIGYHAGQSSGSAEENTYVGDSAGIGNTGSYNAILGFDAGYWHTGSYNVLLGHKAGFGVTADPKGGTYNVFIGHLAGETNNENRNVIIGAFAGEESFAANDNVMIGYQTGRNNTGDYNVIMGNYAGYNGDGVRNVFIGHQCGNANTAGYNVLIGNNAGANSGSAQYSVFVGNEAGQQASDSDNSVFIGHRAGFNNTGSFNAAIGYRAGYSADSGTNVYMGYYAGAGFTGHSSVFIGGLCGELQSSGNYNTFVGVYAGYGSGNPTSITNNTLIGYSAGRNLEVGDYNTYLGTNAGYTNASGSYNVFVGYNAGYNELGDHKLYIQNDDSPSPLIYGEFDNNFVRINGDLEIAGNLTVSGTVSGSITRIDTQELQVSDNIITLNYDWPMMAPTESAGIEIERGTATDARLLWDEPTDLWKAGLAGSEVEISLLGHTHSEYLNKDGSVQLTGDWDFGSFTISGTGDIHCDDLYTSGSTIHLGDYIELTDDGSGLDVNAQVTVGGSIPRVEFSATSGTIGVSGMADLLVLDQDKLTINGDFIFDDNTVSGTGDVYVGNFHASGTAEIFGHVAIGNNAVLDIPGYPTYEYLVNMYETFDPSIIGGYGINLAVEGTANDVSAQLTGLSANAQQTSSGAYSRIRGIYSAAHVGADATVGELYGVYGSAYINNDYTTVDSIIGGHFRAGGVFNMTSVSGIEVIGGLFTVLPGGTGDFNADNCYAIKADAPIATYNGSFDNLYGLYVGDMSASNTPFNNIYNIYSVGSGTVNYFEGDIYSGDIIPTISGTQDVGKADKPWVQMYLADQATGDVYSVTVVSGTLVAALV